MQEIEALDIARQLLIKARGGYATAESRFIHTQ